MLTDGVNAYIYGPGSTPIEQVDLATLGADGAAASTYLIVDALGSVRAATNDSGTLLGSESYNVYGNPTTVSGAIDTPLGYTGQWGDPATGLLYLRARWYGPGLAAFLSVDPALAQTLQPYEYAGDDGVNEVDLTGLLGLNPVQDLGEVANDVNGAGASAFATSRHYIAEHRRGIEQIATIAVGVVAVSACDALTGELCSFFTPVISGLIGDAVYAEGSGPHTAEGYSFAFAAGAVVGATTMAWGGATSAGLVAAAGDLTIGGIGGFAACESVGTKSVFGCTGSALSGAAENAPIKFGRLFGKGD